MSTPSSAPVAEAIGPSRQDIIDLADNAAVARLIKAKLQEKFPDYFREGSPLEIQTVDVMKSSGGQSATNFLIRFSNPNAVVEGMGELAAKLGAAGTYSSHGATVMNGQPPDQKLRYNIPFTGDKGELKTLAVVRTDRLLKSLGIETGNQKSNVAGLIQPHAI